MTESDELRERFPRIAAGEASAAEVARLDAALRGDPRLRREFIEFMNLDAALEDWSAGAVEVRPLRFAAASSRVRRRLAYAAASVLAAALVGWALSGSSRPVVQVPVPPEAPTATHATLVIAEGCRWGDLAYHEGQRLPAGPFRLLAGSAVIRLDGGTLLMLHGDCDLDLRHDGRVDLRRGEVTARAPEDTSGFAVRAPGTTVVDLGTEFAVRVDPAGRTEVHVVEGSVRLDDVKAAEGDSPVLLAERAVRIDQAKAPEAIAYSGEPMAVALRRLRDRQSTRGVLASEPFDDPAGTHAPNALAGGRGWLGPWRLPLRRDVSPDYPGTYRSMRIVERPGCGGVWEAPAGKSFRARTLARPVNLASDGVLYIGLTVHPEGPPEPSGPFEKQGRSVRLSLRSDTASEPSSVSFGFNNTGRPIIETSAGRSFVGRTRVPAAASVRLVAKVLTRAHGEDELSLIFQDDTERRGEIEPAVWDVATRGVYLDGLLRDVVVASHGPAPRGLDDLRFGTTWWSVLPENPAP